MRYDKFSKSYRFEMPSNNANSRYVFHSRQGIFKFFAYYINGISAKLNKTCYKALQKITDSLFQQKP